MYFRLLTGVLKLYFIMCVLYIHTHGEMMASLVCSEHVIPLCLVAWHWRSQSLPPPERRKISAGGLGQLWGRQGGQGLWPALRNRCCGSSAGGGHWWTRCQREWGPCTEAALEYWRGARWGRCPKSTLRRSRWPGTRSPAAARTLNDPSP